MESKTKQELEIMLKDTYNQIQEIDYSCFLIRNKQKRYELVELAKKIKLEIIYREDDEKRLKYANVRKMDPMKNIIKFALLALLIISTNKITAQNNQENDSIISVDLNEVVVSTPFKESVKNNVLNVKKLNLSRIKFCIASKNSHCCK